MKQAIPYVKYFAKGIVATAGALSIALADGQVTSLEWCGVVIFVGGVFGIRNGEKPTT